MISFLLLEKQQQQQQKELCIEEDAGTRQSRQEARARGTSPFSRKGCLLLHETSHVRATQRLKKIVKVEWNSGTWRRVCVPDYLSCPETQIKGGLRRNNPCTLLTEIAATSVGGFVAKVQC
uniref:Uncharacterized protein n=1 Tax=Oryza nivara TaxID=4536 RepID=A0A0E0GNP9_ORYNI